MDSSDTIGTLLVGMLAIAAISALVAMSIFISLAFRGNSATLLSAGFNRSTRLSVRIFLFMAAIGFAVCLYKGTETMLFWMPDNWGRFAEDNSFHPFRSTIAGIIALIGGGVLFQLIIDSTKNYSRLRIAKMQISLERRIYNVGSIEDINSLHDEFSEKLDELKSAVPNRLEASRSLVIEDFEIEMYRELINQIEQHEKRKH